MSLDEELHTFPSYFEKYRNSYEINRIKILKDLIPLGYGESAIDIGCGPGYFSRELSIRGWRTSCIDIDGDNIESARNYALEAYLGEAVSVLSKFPAGKFGLVLCLEIIEHMQKMQGKSLLTEIRRVLKPYGRLILSTPNRFSPQGLGGFYWGEKLRGWEKWTAFDSTHVHIYSSSEILQLSESNGFEVDRVTGYHYGGRLPLIGYWRLPLVKSTVFPLNRIGFNLILECHKQ